MKSSVLFNSRSGFHKWFEQDEHTFSPAFLKPLQTLDKDSENQAIMKLLTRTPKK
jgi:hypothetical protein